MKTKYILISFLALTLLAMVSATFLSRRTTPVTSASAQTRTFQVHGLVRGVDPADKTIRIAHDPIPNFMPAMTMSLPVKDAALLQNVATGDEVQFELCVTDNDSWISHLEKIRADASAMAETAASSSRSLDDLEAECLRRGERVPDFQFTDQDGRAIHFHDFHGKAVVLTFIYTRCPLPNFCPLMSKNFADLEQRLRQEFPEKFQLLSISMDPEFDRPAVLKEYAARYGADPKDWTFAAADAASLDFVARLLGLYFVKENGLISHDLRTALIGPDGRLVKLWKSNLWTPYEIQRCMRETLTSHADLASR
jgi:protein SCO1/2